MQIDIKNEQLPAEFSSDLLDSGEEFLNKVCKRASEYFKADLALIGSLRVAEAERMFIRAAQANTFDFDAEYYNICTAPCQDVVAGNTHVVVPKELEKFYPDEPGIRLLGLKSYVGHPLHDEDGNCSGIFLLEWRREISEEEAENSLKVLKALAPRVSSEVRQMQLTTNLSALSLTSSDIFQDDVDVFRTLAVQAAEATQVKAAFIAECIDNDPKHFRILSMAVDGKVIEDAEGEVLPYDITPCQHLKEQGEFLLERGLQEQYPDDEEFARLGLQSYFGTALHNSAGARIGHLALLHDFPMASRVTESRFLKAIHSRTKQEMQRHYAEREHSVLEEVLIVRQKLESLGLLAGTIAHDFNNHLAAIIGHTELALFDLESDNQAYGHLKVAEQSMWRARDVIRGLMDFAGGTPPQEKRDLSLNQSVEQALSLLNIHKHATYSVQISLANDLPEISAAGAHIEQMMINLVLNAIDAIDEQTGILKISTQLAEFSDEEHRKCITGCGPSSGQTAIMLEVTDNGCGMDGDTLVRIFDPFFSTKQEGRGLGLAGVLGLAKRMRAGMTVSSEPNAGTRFRLYFQGAVEQDSSDGEPEESSPVRMAEVEKRQLLVVDDQPAVLNIVTQQAQALGYDVIQALSGAEAMQQIADHPEIFAVLMDVSMPERDGWASLRLLRNLRPDLPSVMMSGNHSELSLKSSGILGHVELLDKPFSTAQLRECLERVL